MADLAAVLADVEHVILEWDGPAAAPELVEVLAAARRTERVVSIVGTAGGGDAAALSAAVARYAAEQGCGADEVRRISVFVVGGSGGGVHAHAADGAQVRCVAGVTDLRELAEALNERWDAQWCATRQFCC